MTTKLLLSIILISTFIGCKNDPKSNASSTPETQEANSTRDTIYVNEYSSFDGTWRNKTATEESEVILEQKDTKVSGTIMYKEFDDKGELTSSTGLLSVIGTIENGTLTLDIYDPKGRKASTSKMVQDGKELKFVRNGKKINYPDSFSAFKIDWQSSINFHY